MMKRQYSWCGIFVMLVLIVSFCACSSSSKDERKVPTASSIGQPSEVLLVLDPAVMATELKDTLKDMLLCDVAGLNQSEPFFRVSRVPQSIYKGEMLKMHSKLVVKIDVKQQEAALKVAYDVDAKPQIQLLLTSPSVKALAEFLQSNADLVRQMLLDHQLKMQQTYLRRHHSKAVAKVLKAMGFEGLLPEEIAFTKTGENFLWGSSNTDEKQLNFVFYTYASDASELGQLQEMVMVRDSVMQLNIPGSLPDQWMETVWEQGEPIVNMKSVKRGGKMVTELRGLWQMRHGAMGGPFVSYSWYDKSAQRMVVAEGFVYSPSTEKRDLVRRLEAGMRTIVEKK